MAVLGIVSLVAVNTGDSCRLLGESACRFVRYYQALEKSDVRANSWQRVVFSLILAHTEQPKTKPSAG